MPLQQDAFMNPSSPTYAMAQMTTTSLDQLIPMPVSIKATGENFTLTADTKIVVDPDSAALTTLGQQLAAMLQPATGYEVPVTDAAPHEGNIRLSMMDTDTTLGDEGYTLTIRTDGVAISAAQPAGIFYGLQTLRQLLPAAIEAKTLQQGVAWDVPTATIRDYPRFAWRGTMLDVARHFFGVEDVKRYIDYLALYKINRLHLHLSDDQGWRIEIKSWPKLTEIGGSKEVGGGEGGYYTQADYAEIVDYAAQHFITIVPEIDMPGHTNAALASYAELNCDGKARELYTGTNVGFSTLCADKEVTYQFMEDVIRELAAMTPGAYIHIGGDESSATKHEDYLKMVERAQAMVAAQGKQAVGWEEIARVKLLPTTLVQNWNNNNLTQEAVKQGAKIIMSPAKKTYIDMKYDPSTKLGLNWAAYIEVLDAYQWDPAEMLPGVNDEDIAGVEAPLWSETTQTLDDIEFLAFPRLAGHAEIGWSPADGRSWDEYKVRLGAQAARFAALGIDFYRAPSVPWQ
ncbi:MAG: beta-N-acetylhexosaminidase [Anaerolineae bacterium]|nr:beta-N-acetylhexosaminidase [Anaerolineae bacterium]